MYRFLLPVLILFCMACQPGSSQDPKRPNIIVIFTDDQGYQDLGCYGSPLIQTPNIDNMAREGIRLTDFYAAQAVCTASRAGLLTGCYPNRIGIHSAFFPNHEEGIHEDETTLAEMLKDRGYQTAIYGKWHLGDHPQFMPNNHGFDEYYGIPYSNDMWPPHPLQCIRYVFDPLPLYQDDIVIDTLFDQSMLTTRLTEKSVDFIARNKNNPFFLYLAHPMPHVPLFVSDKFKGKSQRGLYGDVIMELDWSTGEVFKALKEHGLDENTLVIYTSDNGPWLAYGDHGGSAYPYREGKGTTWEGGQREPCIIRWPGKLPKAQVIETPMMAIDILPTLAHITGASLPERKIDGKNVWDVWTGKSRTSPQEAYFYYYYVNELHAVRYKNWKLHFPHRYNTLYGGPGGTGGEPVKYTVEYVDKPELFDLLVDPRETLDFSQQRPDIMAKMTALADKMRAELGDALTEVEGTENRPVGKMRMTTLEEQ